MAKIDEITELLTNELNVFKEDVEKLEKLNEKLQATKLKVDLEELRSLLQEHEKKIERTLDSQERIYNRFEDLLKNARIYPTWAVVVFLVSLLLNIALILYSFYIVQ
jgi:ClpP class serine protease